MLLFEIEYLTGVVVAARSDDKTCLDWPPQPDRIFSALVASWGARGCDATERRALTWLERQEPPLIIASDIEVRSVPTVFVPPNDFRTSTVENLDVLPEHRRRQDRRFPSGRPLSSVVRLAWGATPDARTLAQLDAIARDTSYVGHSTSLTRCRFYEAEGPHASGVKSTRRVYDGRLDELERAFHSSERPAPGDVVVPSDAEVRAPAVPGAAFSDNWLVLADAGGRVPDIRATAIVTRKLRDAIMSAWQDPVPEWVSGHDDSGNASSRPHLAVVPLADVGWQFSEGRLMGLALVIPRGISPEIAGDVLGSAIAQLVERGSAQERAVELHYAPGACWNLLPTMTPSRASLRTERYLGIRSDATFGDGTRCARVWTTATPIALDRFPKSSDSDARAAEVVESIRRACRNIGLPVPTHVSAGVASNLRGSPASVAPRNSPAWQRWQLPRSLTGRYLVHATMAFEAPVRGPVIIGAGRYTGLGLCVACDPNK